MSSLGGAPTPKRARIQADVLAATEMLLTEGSTFADLNVERIATRAGISRTAFYFYFRDKRELLMRLAEDVTEQLYAQGEIWWSGSDAETDIREALTNISALYREHGVLLRAIVEVSTYDEEIAGFWRALLGRFTEATQRRIESEMRAGVAPRMPAAATAFALTWMAERAFYQQFVQGDPIAADEMIDALVGIYLRAVYG